MTAFCRQPKKEKSPEAALHEGDIVFQSIPCGSLCQSIIETTPCNPEHPFNHCGIVHRTAGRVCVIEAIGRNVHATLLRDFLRRDTSRLLFAARLLPKYQHLIPAAIRRAVGYEGRPYDDAFLPGDTALYCSELVYDAFRDSTLFPLKPMTFKSPETGATYPGWTAYYKELHQPIPEGLPGINPCAIASSPAVTLFFIGHGL